MSNSKAKTLNPNAAEYVPLVKQGMGEESMAYCPYGSSTQKLNEVAGKENLDQESIMQLEYLQMQFPDVSEEFLVKAYLTNDSDLYLTMDMLNHLESDYVEPFDNLPDTLDIGDVPDSDSQYEHAPPGLKNVTGESSTSSFSPWGSAVVDSSAK